MKCRLTTITPCHVGSGNTLNRNIDFVSDGHFLGIIDPRKIFDIVGEQGIAGWCSVIDRQGDILHYLQGIRPQLKIQDICSRLLEIQGGDNSVAGLREQIFSLEIPYIPGSSIKGAIVSALLGANADHRQIPSSIKRQNGIVDRTFSACEERANGQMRFDPKSSVLRFLHVGDATFEDVPTIAVYCNSLNLRSGHQALTSTKGHQYVEAIYTDTAATFDLVIKSDHLREVQSHPTIPLGQVPVAMQSVGALLQCINTHTLSLLEQERDVWQNYHYPELDEYIPQIDDLIAECRQCPVGRAAVVRLGYGSGWDFITGGWSRHHATDVAWAQIVNAARPKNFQYATYMFPKTRRTFDGYLPLGFARINLVE